MNKRIQQTENKWHYIKNGDLPKHIDDVNQWPLLLLVQLCHDDYGKKHFVWQLARYDFYKKEWCIEHKLGEPYAWYELPEHPKLPEEIKEK